VRIKTQIIAAFAFIILVSMAAFTWIHIRDTRAILSGEIDEKGKLVVNYLKGVITDPLLKKDSVKMAEYISRVSATPGILYIIVADNRGIIAASTRLDDIGKEMKELYPEAESTSYYSLGGETTEVKVFSGTIEAKLDNSPVLIGTIKTGFDSGYADRLLFPFYIKTAILGTVVFFIAVFIAMFIAGRITKPIRELVTGAEIVSSGDFKYKIKVNVKNELQALANSFNDMTGKLSGYYDGILNAFIVALDTQDKYTPGHAMRVAMLAVETARYLKLEEERVENLRLAAILMDVGNLGVDRAVLGKKEMLSPDDVVLIQKHPEMSARILNNISALKDIIPIIMQHHERYDGLGYPDGLKKDEIVKEAKILAVVDAFDAMTTKREHRDALAVDEVVYELRQNKGKQFDPDITEAFVEMINKKGVL